MVDSSLGGKIRARREELGMSAERLGELLGFSKAAVYKWEQGVNMLQLPYLQALLDVLDVDIDYFFPSERGGIMETMKDCWSVVCEDFREPTEYIGVDEVMEGYCEYEQFLTKDSEDDEMGLVGNRWLRNSFRVLVDMETGEVSAIRDYGRYMPDNSDFFIFRNKLTGITPSVSSGEQLVAYTKDLVRRFNAEIREMKEKNSSSKKLIVLIKYCAHNNYIGWLPDSNEYIYVFGYKEYRQSFKVAPYGSTKLEDIISGDDYCVGLLSRAIIIETGLTLYPERWQFRMQDEAWEPMPPKKAVSIPDYYDIDADIYENAIELINIGRTRNVGMSDLIYKLETRVARFERLLELESPEIVVKKEYKLMCEPVFCLNVFIEKEE